MVSENRCWAYNSAQQRCDLTGGHADNHSVSATWTDNECVTPTSAKTTPAPPMTVISEPPPAPTGCVACGHMHKNAECKCGCYEFIG